MVGKVDLRQRRDRQLRIDDDADEQDADHQQRGRDRMPDEPAGKAAIHGAGALGGELSASFPGALDGGASVGCTTEPTWSRYCPATTTLWPGVRPCSTTDRRRGSG